MKTTKICVLFCFGLLLVGCSVDPVDSFRSVAEADAAKFEGTLHVEDVSLIDFNVIETDSLTYPHEATALASVACKMTFRHPDLKEVGYRSNAMLTTHVKMHYRRGNGEWQMTAVESKSQKIDLLDVSNDFQPSNSLHDTLTCKNSRWTSIEVSDYVDGAILVNSFFTMSEEEFNRTFLVDKEVVLPVYVPVSLRNSPSP